MWWKSDHFINATETFIPFCSPPPPQERNKIMLCLLKESEDEKRLVRVIQQQLNFLRVVVPFAVGVGMGVSARL